ncbi:MAG: disulfide bond formation protein B [Candidatus Dojkabacteria bacterium]|nr:MAG: disulfide bond formation protein B [Candidatus Dojkabacteria bacterium]
MNTTLLPLLKKYQQFLWLFIFIVSLTAMLGSLYYSTFGDPVGNVMSGNFFPTEGGYEPCMLCWFARILMYPIVPISAVGIFKKDTRFTDYVLPLSLPGILLDTYHYALQKFPIVTISTCSANNPCNAMEINYLGFITIPFLALTAFIIISVLALANTWVNSAKTK